MKDSSADAIIYVACYDSKNKLIEVKSESITIPAKTIDGVYEFNFTAPNTKTIKFFVWSADGTLVPYTYVKTLK